MKIKISISKIFTILALTIYYVPIVSLVAYSFNDARALNSWGGFSFRWYKHIAGDEALIRAFLTSLKIACVSASFSTIIGTWIAILIKKFNNLPGKTPLIVLVSLPFIIPEVILGSSMLLLFACIKKTTNLLDNAGILTVILAHMIVGVAYVFITVWSRLQNLDKSVEEAAMDLGASPFNVFRKITLPIISKSIIVGWFIAFALSFDDVVIASFVSGANSTTLPMLIHSRIKTGLSPVINVLASLMLFSALSVMMIIHIYKTKEKNN